MWLDCGGKRLGAQISVRIWDLQNKYPSPLRPADPSIRVQRTSFQAKKPLTQRDDG